MKIFYIGKENCTLLLDQEARRDRTSHQSQGSHQIPVVHLQAAILRRPIPTPTQLAPKVINTVEET